MLPDSVAEIETGKRDRQAAPLDYSAAGRLARLAGIRAASDLQEPPARQLELFTFRPASWELEDVPR
jgi:hypothetical protein